MNEGPNVVYDVATNSYEIKKDGVYHIQIGSSHQFRKLYKHETFDFLEEYPRITRVGDL